MTFRQVQSAVENIHIRKHNEFSMVAGLHGHKISPIVRHEEIFLTESEEQSIEKAMASAKANLITPE